MKNCAGKRIFMLVLSIAMLLTMAACNVVPNGTPSNADKATPTPAPTTVQTEPQKIDRVTMYPINSVVPSGLVEGYKAKILAEKGLEVEVWAFSDERTNAILASGDLPDVMYIDSETRFVISFHLSPYRSSPQAFSLFGNAGKYGTPNAVVTDRYWPYNTAVKVFFPNSKHIKVQSFKDDISNNIIESFNDTFKSWYKSKRGFGSFTSANNLIATFIFFYNFIRPHSSLNNLAPAQVAGANYNDKDRCNWILTA
jgi:hypothetical protein